MHYGAMAYTSADFGTTWVPRGLDYCYTFACAQHQLSGANLLLSWILPSMNFVLQESPDLATWSYVQANPALNYTNLQLEATVPRPNGSRFYRLVAH